MLLPFNPPHTLDTLHPTPYTLHPTPYTLHPTPYTLHPNPGGEGERVTTCCRRGEERVRPSSPGEERSHSCSNCSLKRIAEDHIAKEFQSNEVC